SCGTDPNVPPCAFFPTHPSEPAEVPGGSVVSFLEQVEDPNTLAHTRPRVHLLGFRADGSLRFVKKVGEGIDLIENHIAVLGDRIGVVYEGSFNGTGPPDWNVRFRIFDTSGNPITDEELLAANSLASTITALPDRFAIGSMSYNGSVYTAPLLKFRDSAGDPI